MRLTRTLAAGTAVLALSLLAGCSDDADSEADEPATSASEETPASAESSRCKVDVAVSGATEASWTGKGEAITGNTSGPSAFYRASSGEDSLSVYAKGEDFPSSAVVTVGGATYTTEPDAPGVEVSAKGKGATVDAEAAGVDPDAPGVQIVATFDC